MYIPFLISDCQSMTNNKPSLHSADHKSTNHFHTDYEGCNKYLADILYLLY